MLAAVDQLTSTAGIVALAGLAAGAGALTLGVVLTVRTRRMRRAQTVVLGDGQADLVAHAETLAGDFESLRGELQGIAAGLERRMGEAERALAGAIAYRALVRYDALNEMSGHQSTSIALLDATRSGVVLSSIHHRDQSRLYAKQVRDGRGELELSPEEARAVELALGGGAAQT
jgi:hypothetical protein